MSVKYTSHITPTGAEPLSTPNALTFPSARCWYIGEPESPRVGQFGPKALATSMWRAPTPIPLKTYQTLTPVVVTMPHHEFVTTPLEQTDCPSCAHVEF